MKTKLFSGLVWVAILVPLLCLSACRKSNPVMMVSENDEKMVNFNNEDPPPTFPWNDGWVVMFRVTKKSPLGDVGKAGEVYRIENKKLVKIGEFDLNNKSDAEVAKAFY